MNTFKWQVVFCEKPHHSSFVSGFNEIQLKLSWQSDVLIFNEGHHCNS